MSAIRTAFFTPSVSSRVRPILSPGCVSRINSINRHDNNGINNSNNLGGYALTTQSRGIQYLWRKGFWPWKQDYAKMKRREMIKKRNILPRKIDPNEEPIFDPKLDLDFHTFKVAPVRQSARRLMDYQRLIKGRQLDDAIDSVEALARPSADPILNVLNRGKRHLTDRGMDPARLFIKTSWVRFMHYTKQIRRHAKGGYGWAKTPHCTFWIGVREVHFFLRFLQILKLIDGKHYFLHVIFQNKIQMPLAEFFHRTYIQGRTPRSIAMDMRIALMSKRVPREMEKEWAPYLSSQSRNEHRRSLKWRHNTRDFDYYAEVCFFQNFKLSISSLKTKLKNYCEFANIIFNFYHCTKK